MTVRLLAVLCLLGGCSFIPRFPSEPLPAEAEVHFAPTSDGWRIHLVRYRPGGTPTGPPVLLCHGISANNRNLDLDASHSLARWLARQGRDTFAMSLRGSGYSSAADESEGRSPRYSMDTLATQDLPAAIGMVRQLTGASRVDFVGHSMGGLLAYIYLARGGCDLNAMVTLGSPARLLWGGRGESVLRDISPSVKPVEELPIPTPELALASIPLRPFVPEISERLELLLYNPDNVSDESWQKLLAVGVGTISQTVLRQFAVWLQRDSMVSLDGSVDYSRLLSRVATPVLVVAGKMDRTAPGAAVRAGFDALGGPREYFVAGEENGYLHDYGHMDLVIGDRAPVELWPRVLAFLDSHAPGALRAGAGGG